MPHSLAALIGDMARPTSDNICMKPQTCNDIYHTKHSTTTYTYGLLTQISYFL